MGSAGSAEASYEATTWPELARLAQHVPEAGIHFQGPWPSVMLEDAPLIRLDVVLYNREKDVNSASGKWASNLMRLEPWYQDVVPGFRVLKHEELPDGMDSGTSFGSVCINTPVYLAWLVSQGLTKGIVYRRAVVSHVGEARACHASGRRAEMVVNCTGLGSLKLGGVHDGKMYPSRGQIVVVRNVPKGMMTVSGTDDGPEELMYIMNRAAGGGCVLGGCYQIGNWESQADPNLATRIMKRAVELCPELTDGQGIEGLSVIRHAVGLRPVREGGPRVEAEMVGQTPVVHCYGHGGYGFQSSYGSAQAAVELVKQGVAGKGRRARL